MRSTVISVLLSRSFWFQRLRSRLRRPRVRARPRPPRVSSRRARWRSQFVRRATTRRRRALVLPSSFGDSERSECVGRYALPPVTAAGVTTFSRTTPPRGSTWSHSSLSTRPPRETPHAAASQSTGGAIRRSCRRPAIPVSRSSFSQSMGRFRSSRSGSLGVSIEAGLVEADSLEAGSSEAGALEASSLEAQPA